MSGVSGSVLFDKLISSLVSNIPLSHGPKDDHATSTADDSELGMGLMTHNFRRFIARIGIMFQSRDHVMEMAQWKYPPETLSYLVIVSAIILHPLVVVPLVVPALALFTLLLPSYVQRHLIRETAATQVGGAVESGPPIAPAPPALAKPAPVESRDFLLNMRDIQNLMRDYADTYDWLRLHLGPMTNFSNEQTSASLVVVCVVVCAAWLVAVPWITARVAQYVVVGTVWAVALSLHPVIASRIAMHDYTYARQSWALVQQTLQADYIPPRHTISSSSANAQKIYVYEYQTRADGETWSASMFTDQPVIASKLRDTVPLLNLIQPPLQHIFAHGNDDSERWLVDESRHWLPMLVLHTEDSVQNSGDWMIVTSTRCSEWRMRQWSRSVVPVYTHQ